MQNISTLQNKLTAIDGQDYAACQSLLGIYAYPDFKLIIRQIPKDPYAPPHTGIYCIQLQRSDEKIINIEPQSKIQNIAFTDFLARNFFSACEKYCPGIRGTGYGGLITINQPGQSILERNSVVVTEAIIEIRCFLGIPADGRQILSETAKQMFFNELPQIVNQSLFKKNIETITLKRHIEVAEDADFLRKQLESLGLVAFIADGAILPRESGTSDKPLSKNEAIPFMSPKSMTRKIKLPHAEWIEGMGIPRGVTLITGGGYHGKSTLLHAIETGIYNHIPGDGREYCVSLPAATKIRAYSGRYVIKTDISPFIRNLPFQKDTTSFSTENASGSTSQAANIIEAIEAGAQVLLMDEDTCATNFMIRDVKMQHLVNKENEPITTLIDKVRQLYLERTISTVIVLGGVGDYFDVSDQVVQLVNYKPIEVTEKAHKIAEMFPAKRVTEDETYPFHIRERTPLAKSLVPENDYGKFSIYAKETHRLTYGNQTIDLSDLEQLVELSQTKALGFALEYAKKYMDGKATIREVINSVIKDIEDSGIDVISERISGHFAWFRELELAFTLNRIRGFDVNQKPPKGIQL